jgi:hypothetical protein
MVGYQGDLKDHGDRPTFPGSNDGRALYMMIDDRLVHRIGNDMPITCEGEGNSQLRQARAEVPNSRTASSIHSTMPEGSSR